MSKPFLSLDIDVTEALGPELTDGARTTIDAWVFPPNQALAPEVPSTIVLLNGGSYDKRYFHFEVPGRSGYSAAEAGHSARSSGCFRFLAPARPEEGDAARRGTREPCGGQRNLSPAGMRNTRS